MDDGFGDLARPPGRHSSPEDMVVATPERVSFSYETANLGSRFVAQLIDLAALLGMLLGLGGLAAAQTPLTPPWVFAVALATGTGALFLVAWEMRSLARLHAEGTARVERALGKVGTVYLTVPGNKAGVGKVHLNLQNRTVEYQALTAGGELPTGSKAVVVAVIAPDTVEIAPVPEASETHTHV
jgi:hypothetical protein